jgi:hypothetical protein
MAASTITLLSTSLKTTYSEKFFAAMQNAQTPILSDLEECPDQPIYGVGWNFPFHLSSPQNWLLNSEGGEMGTPTQRAEIQGTVNACEFIGYFQITEMLINAGKGAGAFGNELDRHTNETTDDVTMAMQRLFTISHGTGRLAVVDSTATLAEYSTSSNIFYAKNNEGVVALMEGETIAFYDSDSGGSIAASTARKITNIDRQTRKVTVDGAAINFAADWGVYRAGSYGQLVNGVRGLNDDGTHGAAIHGQTRSSYAQLNCQKIDLGGKPLDEDTMRRMCDSILRVGGAPDRIITNMGGVNAYLTISDGDRRYQMSGSGTAKRNLGYVPGDLLFSYHNGNIPFKMNTNLPGGEMNFVTWKRWMKFTNRKLGWLEGDRGILHLIPGTGGYKTSHTAIICAEVNIGNTAPRWGGRIDNFRDGSIKIDA